MFWTLFCKWAPRQCAIPQAKNAHALSMHTGTASLTRVDGFVMLQHKEGAVSACHFADVPNLNRLVCGCSAEKPVFPWRELSMRHFLFV